MEARKYKYEIVIKRTAEVKLMPEESRKLSSIDCVFSSGNDPMVQNKDGLTGFGYKVLISSFCEAISEHARSAGENGFSEGEIIRDAINKLKSNLIDARRQKPKTSTIRRRANKKDKPNGW